MDMKSSLFTFIYIVIIRKLESNLLKRVYINQSSLALIVTMINIFFTIDLRDLNIGKLLLPQIAKLNKL